MYFTRRIMSRSLMSVLLCESNNPQPPAPSAFPRNLLNAKIRSFAASNVNLWLVEEFELISTWCSEPGLLSIKETTVIKLDNQRNICHQIMWEVQIFLLCLYTFVNSIKCEFYGRFLILQNHEIRWKEAKGCKTMK